MCAARQLTHLMSLHRRSKATSGGLAVKQPTQTAPHTSRTEFSESRSTSMGGMRVVHPFTCDLAVFAIFANEKGKKGLICTNNLDSFNNETWQRLRQAEGVVFLR